MRLAEPKRGVALAAQCIAERLKTWVFSKQKALSDPITFPLHF